MLNYKQRYFGLTFLFSLLFCYLGLILFNLQIKNYLYYFNLHQKQNQSVNTEFKRGTIFATFKNGETFPLALDKVYYKLVISPKDIPLFYEDRLYDLLNEITPISKEKFILNLKNKKDSYEELKIINSEEREKIEELSLQGVSTYETYKREYPLEKIAGRIIGFVGGGEDGYVGRYGLEKQYNEDLSGQGDSTSLFFTKIFDFKEDNEDIDLPKNLKLSLEPNVLKFIDGVLSEMKETWQADEVSAIVMDSKTGEILAMDTLPEFDLNKYNEFDIKLFSNPSIQGVYELGSIMKPITFSGAIDLNLIKPTTVYHDYGFVKIDKYTIKNFDEKVRGDQTMQDVISKSLNTGAVYVEKLMGKDKFKKNFENFGLTDMTNIDFPGEVVNKTSNLDQNTEVNFATAAFGQGVALTPISMLAALNIIANNGQKVCPHFLISKILENRTPLPYVCNNDSSQVISTTTAETMKNMLVDLIDNGLAHGRYKDNNYKVAAKTGTAQLPSPDGKYYKDKFVHSYFTFFPATNPKFSVLIYQVNPKKGLLASLTLAPTATKIKDFLLSYYNIPPDRVQ